MSKEEFVKKMTNLCLIALAIGFAAGYLTAFLQGKFL